MTSNLSRPELKTILAEKKLALDQLESFKFKSDVIGQLRSIRNAASKFSEPNGKLSESIKTLNYDKKRKVAMSKLRQTRLEIDPVITQGKAALELLKSKIATENVKSKNVIKGNFGNDRIGKEAT